VLDAFFIGRAFAEARAPRSSFISDVHAPTRAR
jgi:hypothetical protein